VQGRTKVTVKKSHTPFRLVSTLNGR